MMEFKRPDNEALIARLRLPEGQLRMVLDTDTYNEVDDQFALVCALRSPERLRVEAVYAAPFHNSRSSGPGDGMLRSFDEIHRVLNLIGVPALEGFVHKGSTRYLESLSTPCDSPAVRDLIARAMGSEEPLYVVAIGAITNIASAILLEPRIIDKIVVVWLGGHALYWPHTREFNLVQDVLAARVVFDCGVPLVQLPCGGVVDRLSTTVAELERYVDGKSEIGTYLTKIVREYNEHGVPAWSKVIWDVAAVAYLIHPGWTPANLVHSPVLTDQVTWSVDQSRHFIKTVTQVDRDGIFRDLFEKLSR